MALSDDKPTSVSSIPFVAPHRGFLLRNDIPILQHFAALTESGHKNSDYEKGRRSDLRLLLQAMSSPALWRRSSMVSIDPLLTENGSSVLEQSILDAAAPRLW